MGSSNENSAFGRRAQPVGPRPGARRLLRRQRRRGGRRAGAVGARHRHRRLDPPAGGAVRDRRVETHLRRGLALRHDRVRLLARPGRSADARRARRCADAAPHGRPRPVRRDLAAVPRGDPAADAPSAWTACGSASPRSSRGEGIEAGVLDAFRAALAHARGARRGDPRGASAARAARALRLLRDRARRGLLQPRALRRRALRPARRRRRRPARTCTRAPATTASAPRSSAASCSAPTRCPPATTTPTTAALSGCARRSPRTSARPSQQVDLIVTPTAPTVAFKLGEKTARPAVDVPQRLLHRAHVARRHPRDLDSLRALSQGCPSACRSPAPPSARTACSTPPTRSSRRIGFDGSAARV